MNTVASLPDLLDSIADDTRGHSLNGEQHNGLRNAANLIRRLATPEQPGNVAQGELHRCDMCGTVGEPDPVIGCSRCGWDEMRPIIVGDVLFTGDTMKKYGEDQVRKATTQPPAPAAEQGGFRDAYEGAREDLLDWKRRAQKAEATLRSLGYTGITADEPPATQPEARGVEVLQRHLVTKYRDGSVRSEEVATPNPVRAEQPEGKGANISPLVVTRGDGVPLQDQAAALAEFKRQCAAPAAPVGVDALRDALRKAFRFGETHWQQADSEYTSDHRKAGETMAKFKAWADETAAALAGKEGA